MNRKFTSMKYLAAAAMTLSLAACGHADKTKEYKMKEFAKQPYVNLAINGGGCAFVVMVNDIPVYRQYDLEPIMFEQSINQYLTNGKNTIAIKARQPVNNDGMPLTGKNCHLNLTYSVKEKGSNQSFELGELKYQATSGAMLNNPDKKFISGSTSDKFLAVKDGKVETVQPDQAQFQIGTPEIQANDKSFYGLNFETKKIQPNAGVSVTNTLNLQLPYENKALTEGETLEFNESTREDLESFFKQILKDVEHKDEAALNKIFAPQMKNNSVSLYVPESQTNTVKSIMEKANNSDYKLLTKINYHNVLLSVFGNGKLAQFTNWDSTSIFAFNKINGQGSTSYNLTFAKIDGHWRVVM